MNRASRRVCIVTCDIVGPIRNGGIGTAYYYLALALARAGHQVTVLYALGQFCEQHTIAHWQDEYAKAGIDFVPLPAADQDVRGLTAVKTSYAVYQWLKTRQFDIVHCHEWRGVGFYTALAKRQGLCLQDAVLCVGAHSPTLWHLEGMNERADADLLEVDFMERESVALADVLWSPSAHMVRWMRREGWTLPRRIVQKQYILLDLPEREARAAGAGAELVFFGRLETRKGLDLFCDALDRVVAGGGTLPSRVTFLGKVASVDGIPSADYLDRRAARWPFGWEIMSGRDRDAALAYLEGADRIAVLPSRIDNLPYTVLECLGTGVPFVAAATGGIPEMVRPADRARVLCDLSAESLAARLTAALTDGLPPVRMRIPPAHTLRDWLAWHAHVQLPAKRRAASRRQPLVSVCVTTRNRPEFLALALDSLRAQDYTRLEVVVVDDGSDRADAVAALDALAPEFRRRRWQIVRQPNRYPGAARNAGVDAARGDLIMFMDDDNLARPHEVSTLVHAARHSPADIFTCFLDVFQSATPTATPAPTHVWPFLGGAIVSGARRNVFGDANALYRRGVFDRVRFTEDFGVGCEDWEFFARAALLGLRIDVVPEALALYRQSAAGVQGSTPSRTNHMRILRPYFALLPAHLRGLLHLLPLDPGAAGSGTGTAGPVRLDHVQQAVVFGSGEAGRLAIGLANRCGWTVPWIVDNNPAAWHTVAHGRPVRPPHALTAEPVDLIIVASVAGKTAIAAQLQKMGFTAGDAFVHFLDPVRVNGTTIQLSLS